MSTATTTNRVSVFPTIQHKPSRPKPFVVRWKVDGRDRSESCPTKPAARKLHALLTAAAHAGTPFDTATGRPVDTATSGGTSGGGVTCLELAARVIADEFTTLSGKSNGSIAEGLATVLPALVPTNLRQTAPNRRVLEQVIMAHLNPNEDTATMSAEHRSALAWMTRNSLPVTRVDAAAVRAAEARTRTKQDGTQGARSTARRKRAAMSKLFSVAVEDGLIATSPLKRTRRRSGDVDREMNRPIDRTEVTGPGAVLELISYVTSKPLRLLLSIVFYAGLRPSEADGLRVGDVYLVPGECPELHVRRTLTEGRSKWSGQGRAREDRSPKHTDPGTVRRVPIPDALAELLAPAIEGKGADELVVQTRNGTPISGSNRARGFRAARERWAAAQEVAPSAVTLHVPYSLRHCAATLWLTRMPVPEVASRLGHSTDVCLRVYANVIPERSAAYNRAMNEVMTP